MATPITYNSFDLQDTAHITQVIDDGDSFDREVTIYKLARASGAAVGDDSYYTKAIPVSGTLQGTSVSDLESKIDALEAAMAVKSKNLDIGYLAGSRRYVATPVRVSIKRPVRAASWAKYDIDFLATEFGQDTSATPLITGGTFNSSPKTDSLVIGGSAPEQFLLITLTLSSVTASATNNVSFENVDLSQILNVNHVFAAADVLVIDTKAREVRLNGVVIPYTGAFPIFETGTHGLTMTADFSAFSFSYSITYIKRYL